MQPARRDHLRLVRDRPSGWWVQVAVVLCLTGLVALAWSFLGWRASIDERLESWSAAQDRELVVPTVRIECVDWEGHPFGVDVALSLDEAERVARTIERGIAPPYQPACHVQ